MTEQNVPEGKEEAAQGAAWQGVRQQGEALADELRQMSIAAKRRWKINAIVFGVIVLFIASYLGVIYSKLSDFLGADKAVYYGMSTLSQQLPQWKDQIVSRMKADADHYVDEVLGGYLDRAKEQLPEWRARLADELKDNAPLYLAKLDPQLEKIKEEAADQADRLVNELTENAEKWTAELDPYLEDAKRKIPELRAEWTKKAKDDAPRFVEEEVVPRLEEIQKKIPEQRDRLIADLKKKAPAIMDSLNSQIRTKGLPELRKIVQQGVEKQADRLAEQTKDTLDDLVRSALASHEQDVKTLLREHPDKLAKALEGTLEEQLGPMLDEYLARLEGALWKTRDELQALIDGKERGTLTKEQQLEYRAIQLWRTLVVRKLGEYEEEEPTEGSLEEMLKKAVEKVK